VCQLEKDCLAVALTLALTGLQRSKQWAQQLMQEKLHHATSLLAGASLDDNAASSLFTTSPG